MHTLISTQHTSLPYILSSAHSTLHFHTYSHQHKPHCTSMHTHHQHMALPYIPSSADGTWEPVAWGHEAGRAIGTCSHWPCVHTPVVNNNRTKAYQPCAHSCSEQQNNSISALHSHSCSEQQNKSISALHSHSCSEQQNKSISVLHSHSCREQQNNSISALCSHSYNEQQHNNNISALRSYSCSEQHHNITTAHHHHQSGLESTTKDHFDERPPTILNGALNIAQSPLALAKCLRLLHHGLSLLKDTQKFLFVWSRGKMAKADHRLTSQFHALTGHWLLLTMRSLALPKTEGEQRTTTNNKMDVSWWLKASHS